FNGFLPHIESRAAFVLASPDDPDKQDKFKASRDWRFRMVSYGKSTFAADMGYRGEDGHHPGVSVFRKRAANIYRVSDTSFSAGDDFCAIWHFFDLIPEGTGGWAPKYKYACPGLIPTILRSAGSFRSRPTPAAVDSPTTNRRAVGLHAVLRGPAR